MNATAVSTAEDELSQQKMALLMVLGIAAAFCAASICMAVRNHCSKRDEKEDTEPYEQLEKGEPSVLPAEMEIAAINQSGVTAVAPATVIAPSAQPAALSMPQRDETEPEADIALTTMDAPPSPAPLAAGSTSQPSDSPGAPPEAASKAPAPATATASAIAPATAPAPASGRSPKPRPVTPTKGSSTARAGSPARSSRGAGSGSASKFSFSQPPKSRESDTPGPGSYDLDQRSLSVRALASHNKTISKGKGTFMTSGSNDRSAPRMTMETPDPAHYSDYHLEKASLGSAKSANKHVRDGKIAFDSNGPRCGDSSFEDRSPLRGPGHYDYSHLYESSVSKANKNKGTTAFTNKAPLLGYMRKIDTPGVGEYDPKRMDHGNGNSYSKVGTSAFAGNTARCAEAAASAGTAGPETYDLEGSSLSRRAAAMVNPRAPPFGSGGARIT